MAPLSPANTQRFWLKYTANLVEHELCFRLNETKTAADGATAATALATALRILLPTADSFKSLRRASAGSNISFPVAFTAVAGTNGAAPSVGGEPWFYSFVGRSALGRRVRLTCFSPYSKNDANYRSERASEAVVNATLTVLETASYGFVAVDDVNIVWNQYANLGANAYWQRERRRTG